MGVEEGHGGGSRVQGDEGGRQGAGQAPGQEALPWDHLENIFKILYQNRIKLLY